MTETNLSIHEIELAVAQVFGIRNNIIVPNVSWGFFATHEADLVIINKTGYMTEVEIEFYVEYLHELENLFYMIYGVELINE